ncbi:MAG: Mur ligase family protein [Eubacteriales bacterium]|nr:Mur ligase family protein [Eubacteriales bacterium]
MAEAKQRRDFNLSEHLEQIDDLLKSGLLTKGKRVFMLGIAGISMCGLAELASSLGLEVAGSDPGGEKVKAELGELGIQVFTTHERANIEAFKPDFLVYSLAVPADNPERQAAQELGLPCLERAVFLGALNRLYERVINIAGTNGKTTTTALTAKLLIAAGLDPTVHLGAELADFRGTVRISKEPKLMVSEACEFGGSFLSFRSTSAVILNLGHDHVDIFPEFEDVIDVFTLFCLGLERDSTLFLPNFDPAIPKLLAKVLKEQPKFLEEHQLISYGYSAELAERLQLPRYELVKPDADYEITELSYTGPFPNIKLRFPAGEIAFSLKIPGRFNVENALAAFALAAEAGAEPEILAQEMPKFKGAEGRFTYCGDYNSCRIIADYAHHADSLKQTIETAKLLEHQALKVYFQPITYTRAKANAEGFFAALKEVDEANLLEVYDNREKDHNFSTREISKRLQEAGVKANYFPDIQAAKEHALANLEAGDLALFIGQNIRTVANELAGRKDHHERPEL